MERMDGSGVVDVGRGHRVLIARIIAIADPTRPGLCERLEAVRRTGRLLDLTAGRPARSVLVMDNHEIILASLRPKTVAARIERNMLCEVVLTL